MFCFLKLPILATNIVIRALDPKERILMALTSKRIEKCVRLARIKIPYTIVHLREECTYINFFDEEVVLLCDDRMVRPKKKEAIRRIQLKPWINKSSSSLIEDTGDILNRVRGTFLCDTIILLFCKTSMNITTVKEVLENSSLQKWNNLRYHCEQITTEDMNLIMDMASSDRSLWVRSKEVPLDFKHENAFKFLNNMYNDARWVRIEDLFVLRNVNYVWIGKNSFNGAQLRSFIQYWVNCEFDMFRSMEITRNPGIEMDELLDGLLVLEHIENYSTFLTLAKSTSETRKNTKLCICATHDVISLTSSAPYDQIKNCGEAIKRNWQEYKILKLLERKQHLENKLKNNLSHGLSKDANQINKKTAAEIEELMDNLTKLNVVFRNEIAAVIV